MEGRHERGFTARSAVKRHEDKPDKSGLRSVAPAGIIVNTTDDVSSAIAEVRDDVTPTTWVVAGYGDDGDIKKPLSVVAKGTGNIDQLKQHFDDSQAMYALYRTTDTYDDITTVKFVYIYWSVRCNEIFIAVCVTLCLILFYIQFLYSVLNVPVMAKSPKSFPLGTSLTY